eukprot:TRINITY_DN21499_c0_g1_i1.p1 TRINITY_DN21499_c0_g1~~TRINITY_DN21499_c0_g1_i1.p1  ORF type:complete len:211 (-),score=1.94 TRINITY_DN21499_c0_g1_i1:85-675(-)
MTEQICDALHQTLNPKGVAVMIDARHMCMEMRGVEKICSTTVTSALRGLFKREKKTKDEFLSIVAQSLHKQAFKLTYQLYSNITFASIKKLKKPTISVTVVSKTVLPIAGSISNFLRSKGIVAPKKPALKRLITIDIAITTPNIVLSNHAQAIRPMISAKTKPFTMEIKTSFFIASLLLSKSISPKANCLTITAKV